MNVMFILWTNLFVWQQIKCTSLNPFNAAWTLTCGKKLIWLPVISIAFGSRWNGAGLPKSISDFSSTDKLIPTLFRDRDSEISDKDELPWLNLNGNGRTFQSPNTAGENRYFRLWQIIKCNMLGIRLVLQSSVVTRTYYEGRFYRGNIKIKDSLNKKHLFICFLLIPFTGTHGAKEIQGYY